jgi:hypothetical protein
MAEKNHAWKSNTIEGISKDGYDIKVELLFKDGSRLLDFQTSIREQFRRKRKLDDEDDPFAFTIIEMDHERIYRYSGLTRIFSEDYQHFDDADDSNNSPPCDTDADSIGFFSAEVVNITEAEVRVQMIENHKSSLCYGQSPEVAHIKDKCACNLKAGEARDINNHLHMTAHMHLHFDGIETIPIETPSFIVRYIDHDVTLVDCPVIGEDAVVVNPSKKRQRVTVHVIFRDEGYANNLAVYLRDDCTKVNNRTFEMDLYFEDAQKARGYLHWKEKKSLEKWNDLDITVE